MNHLRELIEVLDTEIRRTENVDPNIISLFELISEIMCEIEKEKQNTTINIDYKHQNPEELCKSIKELVDKNGTNK